MRCAGSGNSPGDDLSSFCQKTFQRFGVFIINGKPIRAEFAHLPSEKNSFFAVLATLLNSSSQCREYFRASTLNEKATFPGALRLIGRLWRFLFLRGCFGALFLRGSFRRFLFRCRCLWRLLFLRGCFGALFLRGSLRRYSFPAGYAGRNAFRTGSIRL